MASGVARRRVDVAWTAPKTWHGPVDVVVDVEVEVDADPLEEVVVERDEADFDRHLQVLQAPQLLQQVGDLLVDVLRLADDEAQVGLEGRDRAGAADVVPGGGLDGRGDQVDEAVEVGLGAAAQAAGADPPAALPRCDGRLPPRRCIWASTAGLMRRAAAAAVCGWPRRPAACERSAERRAAWRAD